MIITTVMVMKSVMGDAAIKSSGSSRATPCFGDSASQARLFDVKCGKLTHSQETASIEKNNEPIIVPEWHDCKCRHIVSILICYITLLFVLTSKIAVK